MIWRLAGAVGVNPGPLTLRELMWMAEGRAEAEWAQTSALLAAVWTANSNLRRPRLFRPQEFNPFSGGRGGRAGRGTRITASNIDVLTAAVVGKTKSR